MSRTCSLLKAAAALFVALAAPGAAAQGYPARTIRYVVPFPPAGATDTFVYTIKDGDGDLSTTTLTITLTDSGLQATNDNITVNEAGLPSGSAPGTDSETAGGTLVGSDQRVPAAA